MDDPSLDTETGGWTVAQSYDADGSRATMSYPDGAVLNYGYDGADRLTNVNANNVVGAGFGYDGIGRMTGINRYLPHYGTLGYDAANRLISRGESLAGGAGNTSWSYGLTPASQVVYSAASTGAFDNTSIQSHFNTYAADGLNRDAAIAATGGGYDANGNLTFDGVRSFRYDGDNRLIAVSSSTLNMTLGYDPTGRLIQTAVSGGALTNFVWDDDNLVMEYDGSGNILRRYMHGPGVDNPLVWFEGGVMDQTDPRDLIADRQGSIVGYTDAGGNLSGGAVYTYDPYGVPNTWTGSRFRYTGQLALPEAQLYYYKARVYDPVSGRFLQTDPVGYKSDVNLYAYTHNDPVNKTDPTGASPLEIVFGIIDAASLANDIHGGASAGQIALDVGNLALDVAPIPGLSEVAHVAEGVRSAEHGVEAVRTAEHGAEAAKGGLPKPNSGPGAVRKSERDPKRTFSPADRAAKRDAQGGNCANGCGTKIDGSNSEGHHIERHADGGRTDDANHAEVCKDCHRELHTPE